MLENITTAEITTKVKQILANVLNTEAHEIDLESNIITDLGAESLDIITLIMELEDHFNQKIPDDDIIALKTVQDVVDYIEKKILVKC